MLSAFNKSRRYRAALLTLILCGSIFQTHTAFAAKFGVAYKAPLYKFGGGLDKGVANCPIGEVVVGITFNHNPFMNGFLCKPINDDLTISPIEDSIKSANPNYAFCPDGTGAVGYTFSNPDGELDQIFAGLSCKSPSGIFGKPINSRIVAGYNSADIDTQHPVSFYSLCNSGSFMVGQHYWADYWMDQMGALCAPFATAIISYNLNGGSGKAPKSQVFLESLAPEIIVLEKKPVRTGYQFLNWNSKANGSGKVFKSGVGIAPKGSLILYAQWQKKR